MTPTKSTPRYPLIGAHMSIAGVTYNALRDGEAVGCSTIQIFASSNTQWHAKIPDGAEARRFLEEQARTGITPVVAHNCYLINLASPDEKIFGKSFARMKIELEICARLSLPCLIMHPGAHRGQGAAAAIRQVAEAINALLAETPRVRILYEITAGQGTSIGHTFEQLAQLISLARDKRRVGVCYDTCHAFAAGYDIRTRRAYRETMRRFDKTVGLDKIGAFHFNDSMRELGSGIDRHEHIGRGHIGEDGFRFILHDERFLEVPKILETPKGHGMYWDRRSMALLRGLAADRRRATGR